MVYVLLKEKKDKYQREVMNLIAERGHEYVSGNYDDKTSQLEVRCPKHPEEGIQVTTFYNYKRSCTGLNCCGKAQVSKKLSGRQYSEETIQKMTEAAQSRPYRGGKPRTWRKTSAYSKWVKKVTKRFNQKCAITGLPNVPPGTLHAHHLYCAENHPNLIENVDNGILLHKAIHNDFHKRYKYGNNTPHQFKKYLLLLDEKHLLKVLEQFMPISSQANPGGLEGSETRVYDPERVMKLHERLGVIIQKLDRELPTKGKQSKN